MDAGDFHGSLISSHCETPGKETGVGATRFCQIDKKISVSETIVDWKEGEYYTYEVVDWKNFPLKKMYQTYGVKTGSNGKTILYNKVQYRLSSFFIEWMASGRLKKGTHKVLVYYKDYMETGTVKRPREDLKKLYPEELKRG